MVTARSEPDPLDESEALRLDREDPLAPLRDRFAHPVGQDGRALVYFAGNSLGLQPREARELVDRELERWAKSAVEGHFEGEAPWYSYHEQMREPLARLVGARPEEVVAMNGLTVNLHLMLVSFYRPTAERHRILIEERAFPSDSYAVRSQLAFHGHDPDRGVLLARPRPGESRLHTEDLLELIDRHGPELALVMLGGVSYFTGQVLDMRRIAECARARGVVVGFDLAHAVGNVPLSLHDWDVDFAVWCSYKYLNGGPGAAAGCFVHARHAARPDLPRFAGWWGHDPARRFAMPSEPVFEPVRGADGWQLSNPPILALAPLRAALRVFDEAGMERLRAKSRRLTAFLQGAIDRAGGSALEVVTPREEEARGCQISLRVLDRPRELLAGLRDAGIVGDFREPDVVRLAPVPSYNTFHEVWRVGRTLREWARGRGRAGDAACS